MALQLCCSYNCNMSCKGKGKKFHLFFVKVIIIISELELFVTFQGRQIFWLITSEFRALK